MCRRRASTSRHCTDKQDRRFHERQSPAPVDGPCTSSIPGRVQPKPSLRPRSDSDPDIEKIVTALHDRFKVEYIAPGHCTGEPAFTALRKAFGDHYLYAGLGTTLTTTHAGQP